MPPTRLTRAESKARTLQRVLDAAELVFLERGFTAASMEEIAERAGYSKGAVYASFPNKSALFLEVSSRNLTQDALELFDQISRVERGSDIPVVMGAWFQTQLGRDRPRVLVEAEFWLVTAREDAARQVGSDYLEMSRRTIEDLIRAQAERLGIELPLDPATIAAAAIALRHGLALQSWFDTPGHEASVFAAATATLLGVPDAPAPTKRRTASRKTSAR